MARPVPSPAVSFSAGFRTAASEPGVCLVPCLAAVRKSLLSRAIAVAKSASSLLSFQKRYLRASFLYSSRDCPLCLTAQARAEQQLVIELMTSNQGIINFCRPFSRLFRSRGSVPQFDPRLEPAFERMRRSPHHLISGPGSVLYQGPSYKRSRARGSKEDGTYLHIGIFQPWFSAATHPPWIGMSILSAIETPVAVL